MNKGQKKRIRTVCCVVALGTTTPRTVGVRIGTTTTQINRTTTTGFVLPALYTAGVPFFKEFGREQKSPLLFLLFSKERRRKQGRVLSRNYSEKYLSHFNEKIIYTMFKK